MDTAKKQLEYQCELYQMLLHPNDGDASQYLERALELVRLITGARMGYLELRGGDGEKRWSSTQCDSKEMELIRERISSSIIKEALDTGETIVTPSAFLDERYNKMESVINGRIESVLCSPITGADVQGVIYLQGDLKGKLVTGYKITEAKNFSRSVVPLLKRLKYQISGQHPDSDIREMYELGEVVGNSTFYRETLNKAMTVASFDVSVLLTGETGTGKSFLAKVIHENSPRKNAPFFHLNCANIPETLFESELFGAVKGAHSQALKDQPGKISSAEGGTLFLDEISEVPMPVQAKLLQLLEEGIYYPLGASEPHYANVRIITASNVEFEQCIAAKTFRQDLFYRINTFPIRVPALKDRKDDIGPLVLHFVDKYCTKFKIPVLAVDESSIRCLYAYDWPGNIRELENMVQQAIIKARFTKGTSLNARDMLPESLAISEDFEDSISIGDFQGLKDTWEKETIERALVSNSWNVSQTAEALQVSRSHLNNLIKKHNLHRNE